MISVRNDTDIGVVDIIGTLLFCQMCLEDILPPSTTQFFRLVYPAFRNKPRLNITQMAEIAFMSPQAASPHVHALTDAAYLNRVHYSGWEINSKQITNPVLKLVLS